MGFDAHNSYAPQPEIAACHMEYPARVRERISYLLQKISRRARLWRPSRVQIGFLHAGKAAARMRHPI